MNNIYSKKSASDASNRNYKNPVGTGHANVSIDELIDSIREKIQRTLQKKAERPNRYGR